MYKHVNVQGSECGSVGGPIASDTREPGCELNHHKILYTVFKLYWKDEYKEEEAGNGPFKKLVNVQFCLCIISVDQKYIFRNSRQMFLGQTSK